MGRNGHDLLAEIVKKTHASSIKIDEIQTGALNLPQDQRAALVAKLLGSLPAVLSDIDDGSAEAGRRIVLMNADPTTRRTWEQVKAELGR